MRRRFLATVTAALVLVPATAVSAHPSFNPNAIPAGEAVESVLVVPHGCAPGGGMPEGDAEPTTRVDLGYTDQVAIEPRDVDGWDAADDGEAIVWTDAGGATTDPIELPVTITVTDGAEGDEIFLPAFQECEDGSTFRWVATPDDEQGNPAVKIELTSGPPATVEVEDDGHATHEPTASETDAPAATAPPTPDDDVTSPTPDTAAAADEEPGGSRGTMLAVVAVIVVLVLVGGAVALRRKGSA